MTRISLVLFCSLFSVALTPYAAPQSTDVIVYGGTAGGTIAAIAAATEGASVILLEPRHHLGGMVTGGLGRTDMDRQQRVIGGFSREFFVRAGKHYGQPIAWTFEPHVAEQILNDWVKAAGVEVLFGHRLDTVQKVGNHIISITMENGTEFTAAVYIDSSYEGDLMARANVSYTIGREGRGQYGESLAGIKEIQPGNHQLPVPVSPYDEQGDFILPYMVDETEVGEVGEGDKKVQAYQFRLCLTDVKSNQVPFPRPEDYDPSPYELVKRFLQNSAHVFKTLGNFGRVFGVSRIPNGKTDANSAVVGPNLVGASWEYPDASYERRQEIWDEHLSWTKGLCYFLANDPSVPEAVQKEFRCWGLAADEFIDTEHWPHQLYIREARRMLGEYVLTQHDLQTRRQKYDSIGMGGYNMDVREVQWIAKTVYRFPMPKKEVLMEGYITVPVEPYEIPYRSLLPRQQECDNLLVTSCVSASHMAYSSIRMEPQYMIMGHSAGVTAAFAARENVSVHLVDLAELQEKLIEQGQTLSLDQTKRSAN